MINEDKKYVVVLKIRLFFHQIIGGIARKETTCLFLYAICTLRKVGKNFKREKTWNGRKWKIPRVYQNER